MGEEYNSWEDINEDVTFISLISREGHKVSINVSFIESYSESFCEGVFEYTFIFMGSGRIVEVRNRIDEIDGVFHKLGLI